MKYFDEILGSTVIIFEKFIVQNLNFLVGSNRTLDF